MGRQFQKLAGTFIVAFVKQTDHRIDEVGALTEFLLGCQPVRTGLTSGVIISTL
jgi:hypothetical protein